ncbi:cation diffusion facilitator family transporter [Enterococcus sp. PF1-24]|uniref:cation diffusion facilitator family transporter n=1 Tax=unclassified Enterococcus TaxID=2608891 RepID=UPI0024746B18|nr:MULTISPECIES: cation diffusion facilitator family transporter [unclassified Enterococcus]MDH6364050.1 cation diffusion facilitator family transporter [Enterococcus sp. PFB1-1]MDH6401151.1 cation diffusion facilitator family transporter [Enterococcus sp. PF1-24]
MFNFFLNKLIKEGNSAATNRSKVGILAAILGLISNGVLFASKLLIGLLSGSVSIMADAINNLSDAASSILTLVGFKVASKPADKEHPYGHERFEYISGLIVSFLVTYVGIQFLQSSIKKIMQPTALNLTPIIFIVLLLSVLVKFWQSQMYRQLGKSIRSGSLKAAAQDSLNDVITTATVLVSAGVELLTGWQIDGYMGLGIAIYILYSGIMMIRDFINELMGSRPTQEEVEAMENKLSAYTTILGYHDLLVHNYGPNKRFASVHIEVNEEWDLHHAHEVIDKIEKEFKKDLQVDLVCHLDPVPVNDGEFMVVYQQVLAIVHQLNLELRLHDFRIEKSQNPILLSFDLVVPAKFTLSDQEIEAAIQRQLQRKIGEYQMQITFDHNYLL